MSKSLPARYHLFMLNATDAPDPDRGSSQLSGNVPDVPASRPCEVLSE